MTVAIVNKVSGENTLLQNFFNTPQITTVTGRLYIITVQILHYPEFTGSDITSISSAGGVTWTKATSNLLAGQYPVEMWYGYCTAGSTGVSWTITFGTTPSTYSSRVYIIDEATGIATSGIVVQSNAIEGYTSPVAGTLSAFAQSSNATYMAGICGDNGTQTLTPENGYTVLGTPAMSTFSILTKTAYFAGPDTTPSFSFTGSTPYVDILSIEIQFDGIGGMQPNSLMLMGCGI